LQRLGQHLHLNMYSCCAQIRLSFWRSSQPLLPSVKTDQCMLRVIAPSTCTFEALSKQIRIQMHFGNTFKRDQNPATATLFHCTDRASQRSKSVMKRRALMCKLALGLKHFKLRYWLKMVRHCCPRIGLHGWHTTAT